MRARTAAGTLLRHSLREGATQGGDTSVFAGERWVGGDPLLHLDSIGGIELAINIGVQQQHRAIVPVRNVTATHHCPLAT